MKKIGTLNTQLSYVIARMGHTDKIVVCDSGFPIPHRAELVDLALTKNIPSFIDTLKVVHEDLKIEKAIIAKEMEKYNPRIYKIVSALLKGIEIQEVPHSEFKNICISEENISFVRTGEASPYANVILISGVTF
jgi:D-ribose pyranase